MATGRLAAGRPEHGLGGLQNQGATCYLNSLIQALYVTPEFRLALFQWRYNAAAHGDAAQCIPLALQKLFVRLCLSRRDAVETTELTKSFRWDASESFRQHDVDEMFRVLLDALRRTLRSASFIDQLFLGTVVDFIECKSCFNRRERSESILNTTLYIDGVSTLEEALRRHVQPELLTESNQYACEPCGLKVDALKGVSFGRMPVVLTLQLGRFVFNYESMQRVKLNHRLAFPETLDMSPYLLPTAEPGAPVLYSLYAVLVHQGTALGGHYFAFARTRGPTDAEDAWFEFNDYSVTRVEGDGWRERAFGGDEAPGRAAAYLLVYRRRDGDGPVAAATPDPMVDIDPELARLVAAEDAQWQAALLAQEIERRTLDLTVICGSESVVVSIDQGETVAALLARVVAALPAQLGAWPRGDVRLRKQLRFSAQVTTAGEPLCEGREGDTLETLGLSKGAVLLAETRAPGAAFPEYNPNLIGVRIGVARPDTVTSVLARIRNPELETMPLVWVDATRSLDVLTAAVATLAAIPPAQQLLYILDAGALVPLRNEDGDEPRPLAAFGIRAGGAVYVDTVDAGAPPGTGTARLASLFEETVGTLVILFNDPSAQPELAGEATRYELSIAVQQSRTLAHVKERIAEMLHLPLDGFTLRRSVNSPEIKDLSPTLLEALLIDGSVLHVRHGRPMALDEVALRFVLYDSAKAASPFSKLFGLTVSQDMTVAALQARVLAELAVHFPDGPPRDDAQDPVGPPRNSFGIEHMRLRDRIGKKVGKILMGEATLRGSFARLEDGKFIAVQKTLTPETASKNDRYVLVQRLYPGTGRLGDSLEIVLPSTATVAELVARIASVSALAVAAVSIAKCPTLFGITRAVLSKLKWSTPTTRLTSCITSPPLALRDGDLILFRNRDEIAAASASGGAVAGPSSSSPANGRTRVSLRGRMRRPIGDVTVRAPATRPREHSIAIHIDDAYTGEYHEVSGGGGEDDAPDAAAHEVECGDDDDCIAAAGAATEY